MWVSLLGRFPWRREWQPTPVFMPREYHGQRSLVGYSPWGHTESDTTEATQHTRTHTSLLGLLPTPQSYPSRLSQSPQLSSLCYTAASPQLSVLHMVVYTCQYYSPNLSLPPMPTCPFSTSVSLFLPCRQVHLYHFYRFHIYVLIYICFSPSDFTSYERLQVHPHQQMTHFISFYD